MAAIGLGADAESFAQGLSGGADYLALPLDASLACFAKGSTGSALIPLGLKVGACSIAAYFVGLAAFSAGSAVLCTAGELNARA